MIRFSTRCKVCSSSSTANVFAVYTHPASSKLNLLMYNAPTLLYSDICSLAVSAQGFTRTTIHVHILASHMAPKAYRTRHLPSDSQRFREVTANAQAVAKELKALTQKKKRRDKLDENPWLVTASFKWILLLLYVLSGCTVPCAQAYWIAKRRQKKLRPLPLEDMPRFIEDLFLSTATASIWAVADGESSLHRFARKQAYVWIAKWKLREWLKDKNHHKGLAVSSRVLAQRFNMLLEDIPFGIQPRALDSPQESPACRVFLYRWRRCCNSKWGRVSVQEHVSLEARRAKERYI